MFLGIALDEPLIDVAADEQEGLLLQITGLCDTFFLHVFKCLLTLLVDFCLGLRRCGDSPHLVEGVHVERQVVEAALIVGYRTVGIAVEWHYRVHEVPHFLVGGMEDMGTVLMHVDAFHVLAVNIATQMSPLVDDETTLTGLLCPVGKRSPEQPGPNNKIIVCHFHIQYFVRRDVHIWRLPHHLINTSAHSAHSCPFMIKKQYNIFCFFQK